MALIAYHLNTDKSRYGIVDAANMVQAASHIDRHTRGAYVVKLDTVIYDEVCARTNIGRWLTAIARVSDCFWPRA